MEGTMTETNRRRSPFQIARFAIGCVALLTIPLILCCAANQEQAQQTRQPVYQEQPTRQDNTQQTAQEAPSALWFAVTNPHGRGHWIRQGYLDKTDSGETADGPPTLPPEIAGDPDAIRLYLAMYVPPRADYSVHHNTVTQTVTGENAGTQTNSPSSSPQANPSTTGTTSGGASDQRQQPTASTAIDIPVAAAPGASATGGTPQATAGGGEAGQGTGGAQTNTPTSTGNATMTAVDQKAGTRAAILQSLKDQPALATALKTAIDSGTTDNNVVSFILDAMNSDDQLKFAVLQHLETMEPPVTE
jgi:hypothetical protein